MCVFLYGSIANSEIQQILFGKELTGSPYILKNYCTYEDSNTHEYYVSPVDFGFIRGEVAEISTSERVSLDAFLIDFTPVCTEDSVIVYMRQHDALDIEVPWGRLERLVCDMDWLRERAYNKLDLPPIKKIEFTTPSTFSQAVANYKTLYSNQ